MDATFGAGNTNVTVNSTDVAARADAAVADNSRCLDGQSLIVDPDADRFHPDVMGHWPTELQTESEAA